MATTLLDIKNIQINLEAKYFYKPDKKDFQNYFRLFKKDTEDISQDSFYSPFFPSQSIMALGEHYGDKVNAMQTIWKALKYKNCLNLYVKYDFSLACVEEYVVLGDFEKMKSFFENLMKGFYIGFMVSHFNQILTYSPLTLKREHYHIILVSDSPKAEYLINANHILKEVKEWNEKNT